ncbi:MAG: DUF2190 family protein, partial [Candidatus Brocadiia bacterium]
MADSQGGIITFKAASSSVDAYLRVSYSSGQAALAGAGEDSIGVVLPHNLDSVSAGDYVPVELWNNPGVRKVTAAGAFSAGATLYGAASGKVDDTATGEPIGIALDAATDDGDVIRLLPAEGSGQNAFTTLDDSNGNESLELTATSSAVNHVAVVNAITTNDPVLAAAGDDTNINLVLRAKGSGTVELHDAGGLELLKTARVASAVNEITIGNAATGNNPTIACTGEDDTGITFQNDAGEEILILDSVASSVNEITIASAATGNNPVIKATGESDTGITLANNAGEEIAVFDSVATSVNELKIASAATGNAPTITAQGDDANVGIDLVSKGTG